MKKLFLTIALVFGFALSAQDKGLNVGVNIGIPAGDASDISKFSFGVDATYFFWEPVANLKIGASTGYTHFIGKNYDYGYYGSYKVKDFGFVPVAATGEYRFAKQFFAGLDLGVAIATQSDSDTGFYVRPKIGWDQESYQLFAFVRHISQDTRYASALMTVGVGGAYKF